MKNVYVIVEKEGAKAYWLKVGAAFENKDGSLNVVINALPLDGRLHIREPFKDEKEADEK